MKRRAERTSTTTSSFQSEPGAMNRKREIIAFRKKILAMGLGLIPAWGFKDVVGSFISWTQSIENFPKSRALPATIVLAFAVVMAITLPEKAEGAPFWMNILGAVNASLGLGVAYAFNQIIKDAAGDSWSEIWFQAVYVPIITLIVSFGRPFLLSMKERMQSAPLKKLFEFLASSSGYLVAWSWNQFLVSAGDKMWEAPDNDWVEVCRQLLWASLVTGIAAAAVALLPVPKPGDLGLQSLSAVTVLSAGINVGSFWSNVASAVYDAWGGGILFCWLLVLILTFVVPPLGFFVDRLLQPKVGRDEEEIQKQVQLTDDGGSDSFVPGDGDAGDGDAGDH